MDGDKEGVLLYYKYVDLTVCRDDVQAFYEKNCGELGLKGRVRVARDGINATLGGTLRALESHIGDVKDHPVLMGQDIDFKLAESGGGRNCSTTVESGFDRLSVKLVDEVVTLGPRGTSRADPINNAGAHLSPVEFHTALAKRQGNSEEGGETGEGGADSREESASVAPSSVGTVLVDARNLYETRIGKFQVEGVATLDPELRCFSDLPAWVDRNEELLRGKHILMYCTGGVRCERASAYIKDKGVGFQDVFQLRGGIQRYLETFPDGGFFRGKNFVFDERVSVPPEERKSSLGRCLLCGGEWDDYGNRQRCKKCRMLILVCSTCGLQGGEVDEHKICEICRKTFEGTEAQRGGGSAEKIVKRQLAKKLKILCLHGFRQTGKSFRGRTCALRKKLSDLAEFVFIDAPHELTFVVKDRELTSTRTKDTGQSSVPDEKDESGLSPTFVHDQSVLGGERVEEFVTEGLFGQSSMCGDDLQREQNVNVEIRNCAPPVRPRRAWLVSLDDIAQESSEKSSTGMDENQWMSQTEGWETSRKVIEDALRDSGPFDGIMGFSQGASVAALLCALQHDKHRSNAEGSGAHLNGCFRFAIIASGYISPVDEHRALFSEAEKIDVPSLHIFGGSGNDRQILTRESGELARCFDPGSAHIVRHGAGHIIPTPKTCIMEYRRFLERFI